MTQDEIIRMAIDAGLGEYLHLDGWRFTPDGDDIKSLERFYELAYATGAAHEREKATEYRLKLENVLAGCEAAVLAEREACAKVCDEALRFGSTGVWEADRATANAALDCAAAIRQRGLTKSNTGE